MRNHLATRLAAAALALVFLIAGCSSGGKKTPDVPKLKPEEASAVRDKAVELIKEGKTPQAAQDLQRVTEATPKDAKAHFLLGVARFNNKNYGEAVESYKAAIAIDSNYFEAYNNMGNAYREWGKPEDARAAYQKCIQISPLFAYAYSNLADLHVKEKKYPEALSVLEAGLKANPSNLEMKVYYASILHEGGQKEKALVVVEEVLKASPEYAPAKQLLADINKK